MPLNLKNRALNIYKKGTYNREQKVHVLTLLCRIYIISRHTFDTFCHKKSVLVRDFGMIGEKLADCRYPPYTRGNVGTFRKLMQLTHLPSPPSWLKPLAIFSLGVGSVIVSKAIAKSAGQELPNWL